MFWCTIKPNKVTGPYFFNDGSVVGDKYKRMSRYNFLPMDFNYHLTWFCNGMGLLHSTQYRSEKIWTKSFQIVVGRGVNWFRSLHGLLTCSRLTSFWGTTLKQKYSGIYSGRMFQISRKTFLKLLRVSLKKRFKRFSKTLKIDSLLKSCQNWIHFKIM